jgi:hypothetical protein
VTVPTQADRGQRYTSFVSGVMRLPYIVGMHWFEWSDEPDHGRIEDGEDSNYGLVDIQDREYEEVFAAAKSTHAAIPSPSTRAGTLPAPADRDGTLWSAPPLAQLPEGKLAAPVEMVGAESPYVSADDKAGAHGSAQRSGNAWQFPVETGTGWGLAVAFPVAPGTKLAGAHAVRVVASGPAGMKLRVFFNELGIDQPAPGGIADGEAWGTPPQALGTGETTLVFDLREAEVNAYYGKQGGNRRLDLNGLSIVGVNIPGGQGAGTVTIRSLTLE